MKFRIWLKGLGRFATDEWYLNPEGKVYFENIMDGVLERANENSYVVQRSTGLMDKNGVEIYEGDYIKYDHHPDSVLVRWTEEGHDWHPGWIINDLFTQYGPHEIIGNIFDK